MLLHKFVVLFALIAATPALGANCSSGGTTMFFGNGVFTTQQHARAALWDLESRVDAALDSIQANRDRTCVQYNSAYDSQFVTSTGLVLRTGNALAQLADAAVQAALTDYSSVWSRLFQYSTIVPSLPDGWDQALGQLFSNILVTTTAPLQGDLQQQKVLYQTELNSGNNVITVAHSQGNLYVNEAVVLVSVPSNQRFDVVAVATPGDHVPGGGPWVTLQDDIILLVPFALSANTFNTNNLDRCYSAVNLASRTRCHDFEESYLTGDISGPKIMNAVTNKIDLAPNNQGLVGWWTFDTEDISGSKALDKSGLGNKGTIHGATATTGRIGQALNFNGVDQYVDLGDPSSLHLMSYSISAWVRPANLGSEHRIVSNGGFGAGNFKGAIDFLIDSNQKLVILNQFNGGQDTYRSVSKPFQVGVWAHVAVTYDSNSGAPHLYVNGSEVAGAFDSGTSLRPPRQNPSYNFRIGATGELYRPFYGDIDEVRIYTRPLSASEVNVLY